MSRDEQPASGMTGLGIHLIDAMIALTGPVEKRSALTFTNVQMRLASGEPVYFGTSIATGMYYSLRVFRHGWLGRNSQRGPE